MLFFSDTFLFVLLPLTLVLYYAFGRRSSAFGQKITLLAASLIFYASWRWRYVFLLLLACAITFIAIRLIERRALKGLSPSIFPFLLGVGGSLSLLVIFKYSVFWSDVFFDFSGWEGFKRLSVLGRKIVLPLGISFYTLQGAGAVIDRWRAAKKGLVTERTSILDFFVFKSFFAQLVAGPITRMHEIFPQLHTLPKAPHPDRAARGLTIFAVGLAKKILLADNVAYIVNSLFQSSAVPTSLDAAIGALAYTLQLYFDFSGYSDMAVGLGALFGFEIPVNFLSPYRSTSFTEYWRKNHITLSFWFRDYLYIPLGGSRCGLLKRNLNIIAVMGVAGLWHGASWTFIVWGLYQALFIILHRVWLRIRKRFDIGPPNRAFAVGLNFMLLTLGLVLFRATSFERAVEIYQALGSWTGGIKLLSGIPSLNWAWMAIATVVILFFPNIHEINIRQSTRWALATGLLLAVSIAGVTVYSPFIYYQF